MNDVVSLHVVQENDGGRKQVGGCRKRRGAARPKISVTSIHSGLISFPVAAYACRRGGKEQRTTPPQHILSGLVGMKMAFEWSVL